MARDQVLICALCAVIVLSTCTVCHSSEYYGNVELTAEYSIELQTIYEDYTNAVVIAYETGNISRLQDVTTGYALNHHTETTGSEGAKTAVEWFKVEVYSLTVTRYHTDTAEILVSEEVIGNIPAGRGRMQSWICNLQKDNGKWKVSSCGPVLDQ